MADAESTVATPAADNPMAIEAETGEDAVVAPDPYDITNDDVRRKISQRMDKKLAIDRVSRTVFERGWFRNLCFSVGQQQIVYDHGKFRLRRVPAWFPKSQTNKFAEKYRDLLSALMQGRVPIRYLPATEDNTAQWSSEVGERLRDVIYSEAKIDEREAELGSWFILTGNAFIQSGYDYDEKHGTAEVPKLGCATCQATYGSQDVVDQGIDADNPQCPECAEQGQESPLGESEETELLPIGSLTADFLSAFEIRCDFRIRDYRDWTWYIRQRRYDQKFAETKWGKKLGDTDKQEDGDTLAQHYLDILAQITDAFNPAQSLGGQGSQKAPKVTAYEFYELPTDDFPEGLCAIRVGSGSENIVEAKPLPTEYGAGVRKGQKFLNIVHLCCEKVPGRLWGKTPLDDAVPLQIFRNIVESNIRLTVQRMGNVMWLNPKGSGVENLSGEPGQIITYNPLTLGGTTIAKPERIPAELSSLQALLELLKFIDDQIERVTGTYFLQGGEAPQGVTAASALALLDERAKKAMSPLTREWAKGFLAFDQQALEIARANWTDQRIRIIAGRNKKFQTVSFMNSDLQGAVNMDIDYEAMAPKSNATKRAEIAQLIQGAVVNPSDEQQKYQILKAFGQTGLLGSIDLDVQQAQKEWEAYLLFCKSNGASGQQPIFKAMNQNSTVHFAEHCDASKTDEYDELTPEQQSIWDAHIQAHAADIGARRAFFAAAQLDPDAPQGAELGTPEAQAAVQAGQGVMSALQPPQQPGGPGAPGTQPGALNGNNGPKRPGAGPSGNGANQAAAVLAKMHGAVTNPIPDIGAAVQPTAPPPPQ